MTSDLCLMSEYQVQAAELLLRTFTGILFITQGYDKLFRIGMRRVIDVFSEDAREHRIPGVLVRAVAWYTALAEFSGGALLLAGLFSGYALIALGIDLVVVCAAFSFMKPMWDMKHVFPRFILIILLLLIPSGEHLLRLDNLI